MKYMLGLNIHNDNDFKVPQSPYLNYISFMMKCKINYSHTLSFIFEELLISENESNFANH